MLKRFGLRMFKNRREAGKKLAAQLLRFQGESPVVVALPRGGVVVGYEVAASLGAPLDVVLVRKLGAPGQPALGIGAVCDGDHPESVLNEEVLGMLQVPEDYLQRAIEVELEEIRRRQAMYRQGHPAVPVEGRTVIVVDDGIATGGSVRAAVRGLRRRNPKRLVLAVPVAPPETVQALRGEVDELVCLSTPFFFCAVGEFYEDFRQTTDEEVVELLERARRAIGEASAARKVKPD